MVGIAGVAMRFFKALAARKINIILITQASSEHTICCAIDPKHAELAKEGVNEEFGLEIAASLIAPLFVEEDLAIISVVGEKMRSTPGMSGRVFSALGRNGINVIAIAQGSSELNISAVIPKRDEVKGLNALHDEFFVGSTKTIHVWLIGTGLIGGTLLRQIERQKDNLRARHGLEINLQGVANRRWMRLASDDVTESLELTPPSEKDTPFSIKAFLNHVEESTRSNEIFVDCTSSGDIPYVYPELLAQSIPVVTPNKKGLAGELSNYKKCKEVSIRRRTPFLHETTVGAGLPILNTLSDLVRSGDTLITIEAVLSGTLSYIFNAIARGVLFADAVREAKRLGLTEPDPRDDLSGLDVARKVLILSREGGLPLSLEDIKIQPILPDHCSHWNTEEFLSRLDELNPHFSSLFSRASAEGLRPFFSASIDFQERSAQIGIALHPKEHPFSALSGSDNIIAFTTERYQSQPLVVKGPGAGAEVTAAGVFADIIRIAH
jgi:aspartokinase/homoserine dehydrogenase 1